MTTKIPKSQAALAMDEAIELELEGRNPYPKRAMFLDADEPGLGKAIAQAADDGLAVVLCYVDGTRRIIDVRAPAAAG
jgi:hypothetical protein